jgi:hypothetical protein
MWKSTAKNNISNKLKRKIMPTTTGALQYSGSFIEVIIGHLIIILTASQLNWKMTGRT